MGAFALAAGYIAQRMAMQTGVQPPWASFIRLTSSGVVFWLVGWATGWSAAALRHLAGHRPARRFLCFASLSAATGVWCSSTAMAFIPAGAAATIIGLQPIGVALLGAIWYRRMPHSGCSQGRWSPSREPP